MVNTGKLKKFQKLKKISKNVYLKKKKKKILRIIFFFSLIFSIYIYSQIKP
jgi:uncharacterized membrane protein